MRAAIKRWWFGLLGKDPESVIVCFRSGDPALAQRMCDEIRMLEPSRRVFEVSEGTALEIARQFRRYRIGLAPVLFDRDAKYRSLRRVAWCVAPRKILAYNSRLERHHLSLSAPIASWLFLRGVPLDRIFLRPKWFWPRSSDRTVRPTGHRVVEGRARRPGRKSIAVLTPYFPYPLSHGGAVRMFNLLREAAREFDVILYAFTEAAVVDDDLKPVLEFVSHVYLVPKPRYREPRWSTVTPPEVEEYRSPEMSRLIAMRDTDLLQTEYAYLASYNGDILVEHDVTFDLYAQIRARHATIGAKWDEWRWRRYERRMIGYFRRVVVMSEKDHTMLGIGRARVIENGVDLKRFGPRPESPGRRLLFIGSFRHFPNIVAFRFLTEQILPMIDDFELTVVAGPEPWLHWTHHTGEVPPLPTPRVHIHEFVADVRPLYFEANVVVVPTLESAGTNVKVLEALAMERAVVSTASGCAGLALEDRKNVWIADTAAGFAAGVRTLLGDDGLRSAMARAGRGHVETRFDWRAIGVRQRELYRELLGDHVTIRRASPGDLEAIARIQAASPAAAEWNPEDYLAYDCRVAVIENAVAGFLVSRATGGGEREILNLAVDPAYRRRGLARRLMDHELLAIRGTWFLEVRESNGEAIAFYESSGFEICGRRADYYRHPAEAAIVMRFLS